MSFEFKNQMLSNYKIKKILGKGTFSTVKLAVNKETGEEIAIKILEKNKIKNKRDINRIEREISMVKIINHPNIAEVFDIIEDEERFYILMEYCENGELFNLILERHNLSEEESAYFYYQIINGLEYIHINNIIHRDLKPENLLLNKKNILKIIDFGLSNYNTEDNLLSTPCGSPCYASPEMVSGKKYNGFTSDVWSTGIILYAMIYGYLPFENLNNNNDLLFRKIKECKVDYPRCNCYLALDLLKKILVPNPNERFTISEIKRHKFYLKGKNIFNHRHKDLNLYKNIESRRVTYSENNIYIKNNSREKKYNSYNNSLKNNSINRHEKVESEKYCNNNDFCIDYNEEDSNKRSNKKSIYKNKNSCKKNVEGNLYMNNISCKKTLNYFHKIPMNENNQRMTNVDEEFFTKLNVNEQKRNTYCKNINNNEENVNNLYSNNSNFQRKNNYTVIPPLKMEKIQNNEGVKFEEEKKNQYKRSRKNIANNQKLILTNLINNQNSNTTSNNRTKNIKIGLLPMRQTEISNSINDKNLEFPDLNSYSIDPEAGYIYQALSNLKKISPLNIHNKKNIKIILHNDDNREKKKGNDDNIISNGNSYYINKTDNYFNKKVFKEKEKEENKQKNKLKKFSSSVEKKRYIDNRNYSVTKNISVSKNKKKNGHFYLKEIEESKDDSKKDSIEEINKEKNSKNKRSGLNNYFKYNTNSKVKEISPVSIVNFKPNNSFLVCTPSSTNRKDNYTFLKKAKINANKFNKQNNPKNFSFNNEINKNEKIFSFIKDKQIKYNINVNKKNNESKEKEKNENIKISKISERKNNNHLTRNSNEIKSELNNHVLFSSNYRVKHMNNKSLEDNCFNKRNNIKSNSRGKNKYKESYLDNYENVSSINHKRSGTNKKNINTNYNNNFNNNYIKIISDSKKETNSKILRQKYDNNSKNSLGTNYTILNYTSISNYQGKNREKSKGKEGQEKEIQEAGHKYYKEKKENLRLTINKIHNNKISDDYLSKINYSNKAHNSNNINKNYYLKYDINDKAKDIYNTERNEMINNNNNQESYTYAHRDMEQKNNLSNKCLNIKKEKNGYKINFLNEDKNITEVKRGNKNSSEKDNNNEAKKIPWINASNIINNISKINISSLPSITIDMNVLNKNNMKYLKYYDSIKKKL